MPPNFEPPAWTAAGHFSSRIYLEPMRRPDPVPSYRGGLRNDPLYSAWLEVATLAVRTEWRRAKRAEAITGPVLLVATFWRTPPKSLPKWRRGTPCARKPDLDRFVHALQDALTHAGVIADDNQISDLYSCKRWSDSPAIDFAIYPIEVKRARATKNVGRPTLLHAEATDDDA